MSREINENRNERKDFRMVLQREKEEMKKEMETFRSKITLLQADGVVATEQLGKIKERNKKEEQEMSILSSRVEEYIKKNEKEKEDMKIKMKEMEKKVNSSENTGEEEIKKVVKEKLDKDEETWSEMLKKSMKEVLGE